MVGWDTVTDICRNKGRFSGEPPFVFLGAMRVQQSATAVCAAICKSDVMTQASQWPADFTCRPRSHYPRGSEVRDIVLDYGNAPHEDVAYSVRVPHLDRVGGVGIGAILLLKH
jgi:hypothetical protein